MTTQIAPRHWLKDWLQYDISTGADSFCASHGQGVLRIRLEQISPTAVVLSICPEDAYVPHIDDQLDGPPAIFNLSIVAERAISLTDYVNTDPDEVPALTRQQLRLINLLPRTGSQKAAAKAMGLSLNTVEGYMNEIRTRLDAKTEVHAVAKAARWGLLAPAPIDPATGEEDTSHADVLDSDFDVAPRPRQPTRIEALDTRTRVAHVLLFQGSRNITIGRGDDERVIAIGTRGRVHIAQIRRPFAARDDGKRRILLAYVNGNTEPEIAEQRGISKRTVQRFLAELQSDNIPPAAIAAQSGLLSSSEDVHQPARQWFEANDYAAIMQPDWGPLPDALSPIFATYDS